jgi:hypothetical protein
MPGAKSTDIAFLSLPSLTRQDRSGREFQSLASRRYCDTEKLRRAERRAIQVFLAREGLA